MQKQKRTRTKKTLQGVVLKRKAVDLLYQKMMFYAEKSQTILKAIIQDMNDNPEGGDAKLRIQAMRMLKESDELAIDCAVKLAPFQSPKLESVEVNNKVEHRYVMRAPAQFKSTDDWAKATGAKHQDDTKDISTEVYQPPSRLHIQDLSEPEDDFEDQRRSLN